MVNKDEALKLALDALSDFDYEKRLNAIKAVQEALAQPAQEPFGWYSAQEDEFMTDKIRKEHGRLNSYTHIHGKFDLPLYTTPPQRRWVGLTEEEIKECFKITPDLYLTWHIYERIEAKLKEKNT